MFHHHIHVAFFALTVISGEADDGGGVTGVKAAKPVTTVQDCVSTFVTRTPQDIFT